MAVSGRKAEGKSAMSTVAISVCGPCEIDGEQLEACGFCLDCADHLCKDCFRSHGKSKASRHHKLLTNDKLSTTDVVKAQSRMCFETCDKHTTEIIKFFCTEHKTVGCSDCVALEHRTCALQYIPEEAEGFPDSVEYKDTKCALETELEKMNFTRKKVAVIESMVEYRHDKCLKDIDSFYAQMIKHITDLRDKIVLQANNKKKKNEKKIENARATIQMLASTLREALTEVQTTGTAKQNSQLFMRTKKAKSLLQSHKIKATKVSIEAEGMFYQFKEDAALQNVLSTSDTLGILNNIDSTDPLENAVVVLNIPKDVDRDNVELYFETLGGEVVYSEVHEEEGYAIVGFEDPAMVSLVCYEKDNNLFGTRLQLQPFIECLGMSPSSFRLDPALDKIRYIKECPNLAFQLEKVLSKYHANIIWTEDKILVQCTMTLTEMSNRNLLRSWKDAVYQEIEQFIGEYVIEVLSFPASNWTDVKEALEYISVADPTTIFVRLVSYAYTVIIIGCKGYKKSDMQAILDKIRVWSMPE